MVEADVAVVGGGPAGSAAAITLARTGRRVVLVDKATFPRDKCCGDGLTTSALRDLEALGLRPDAVASWHPVTQVALRAPSGRRAALHLPTTHGVHAVVARRADLDTALLATAAEAGVDVRTGHGVSAVAEQHESVALTVDGLGELSARYVIAADGMWSPLRRLLGVIEPGYRGEWHAFRQYFTDVTGPGAHELAVWFEPDLLPGYAWSFPLPGGVANVGLCVLRGERLDGAALAATWASLLERPHVRAHLGVGARPESERRAWPIPARIDRMPRHHGRVLFAGDALAAPDLLTGEGVGQALSTGALAARAIAAAGPFDAAAARRAYARAVDRQLVADHRMSALLGRALSHRRGTELAVAVAGTWGRRNFARWLFEDEPRAVLLTPRRWHRDFLARDGAFATPRGAPSIS